jgi:MoaA/NifB/PqqE/SkfB family radical SAM enzyme
MSRPLRIWYVSALQRCNFRCSYCVTGQARVNSKEEWAQPMDLNRHVKVLEWIAALPYRVTIRIASIGEPFVSGPYLDSLAKLSHSGNIEFLELLTNGSFAPINFQRFVEAAAPERIRMWMTFHPGQVSRERFLRGALLAREKGVEAVVHALLFPDNVEEIRALKTDCEAEGLRLHIGYGLNFNNAFPDRGLVPILEEPGVDPAALAWNTGFSAELYRQAENPSGALCAAGHDYVYIDPCGSVHRCRTYSLIAGEAPLGNIFDPSFKLKVREQRYSECRGGAPCVCVEDQMNLKTGRESFRPDKISFVPWSKEQFLQKQL